MSTDSTLPAGTAPVKPEFLLSSALRPVVDDDAAEGSTSHAGGISRPIHDQADTRSSGPSRKKMSREQKKAQRGANKGRRFGKVRDELELCWRVAKGSVCELGSECRFTHDVEAYIAAKPRDIRLPSLSNLTNSPPFVELGQASEGTADGDQTCLDPNTTCVCFEEAGDCRLGLKCRFLGAHASRDETGAITLVVDEQRKARLGLTSTEMNYVSQETLKLLRTRKFPRPITDAYMKELEAANNDHKDDDAEPAAPDIAQTEETSFGSPDDDSEKTIMTRTGDLSTQIDTPDVPARFVEKNRLHWAGKTYLAPLTTVGNLPFRRLCVSLGADITCGEMGLATSFLSASREEWSLVRRHPSETIFGVQLAGNKPSTMVATAEILGKEFAGSIDFVDINCGCPIDLVFRTGSGSALLDAPAKLGKIIVGMNRALGEIPVTVKLRTGVKDGRNTSHKLMPRIASEWKVGCMTLHGRTRQQRYTKLADWGYIKQCVDAVRAREADEGLSPIPIFGGGDCFSSEDYWNDVETTGVDGVMIGRGALIKPWIFTEVKERREWDISSRERLDLIGKYAEFGLSHFGTDTAGVNTTRRYLCEALSFQHRYLPIGLLERLPGRINDRSPAFRGRDELETLLASTDSRDWVRISEMFLGPAPESFIFTPKHKSNAYGGEEGQG
ncbi:zinc finger dihydrouridine synthase [Leucogyrophana mollusca]|uniref:Zinc finger dihydrouridine synthase n=1 Tax=Leucogyrophana mollusca TaxID=85980 RepID=A0ACB8BUU0_9AGAM|nr:zinc finger dihydrouridine synthase [Leucogyrophana mollusca]